MGNTHRQPNLTKHSNSGKTQTYSYGASTMQGWRTYNEDQLLLNEDLQDGNTLFAVFDGHGGCEASFFLKMHFSEILLSNEYYKNQQYEDALKHTFLSLDKIMNLPNAKREMENYSGRSILNRNFGSTALVTLITPTSIYVANAGDCRAVIGHRNQFQALSQDHKPELEQEFERIKNANGFVQNGRVNGCLSLSRALGDYHFKLNNLKEPWEQLISPLPDITITRNQQDQFMILACDGVWECITQEILMNQNNNGTNLAQILENVFNDLVAPSEVFEKGQDNMSAILIQFK